MNSEAYGYVVLVAILGMSIVFLFLWFLSGIMSAIKLIFGVREHPGTAGVTTTDEPARGLAKHDDQTWIIATVTAFLDAEERERASDPGPWIAGRPAHGDPWLTAPTRREL